MSARWSISRGVSRLLVLAACAAVASLTGDDLVAQSPIPGANVNMVRGTRPIDGDPYLQRQNEPSIAVSSRNPCHLLAGANDYRTVDIPDAIPIPNEVIEPTAAAPAAPVPAAKDAWLGVFQSSDCGATWRSTLIPGYPQDVSAEGSVSPNKGLAAGADPTVRAGTNGLFLYSGLTFNRGDYAQSQIFVARYIDNNNKERGDTIQYIDTVVVAKGPKGQFVDKPWLAIDRPRAGFGPNAEEWTLSESGEHTRVNGAAAGDAAYCTINGQRFPAGNAYMAWTRFDGSGAPDPSKLMFARSIDCGKTWDARPISNNQKVSHAASIAIAPHDGTVFVTWREIARGPKPASIHLIVSRDGGKTFSKPVTVASGINAFDQERATSRFRTKSFPTVAADHQGRVYIAWAERGFAKDAPDPLTGDARIVVAVSKDYGRTFVAGPNGQKRWAIDDARDSIGEPRRGHQIMPAMTFVGGTLHLVYYDFADDYSTTYNAYVDDRDGPVHDPDPSTKKVFRKRHTVDVRGAQAAVADVPVFTSVIITPGGTTPRLTRFRTVTMADGTTKQVQYNPPNYPLYVSGTIPFIGDYIDIQGLNFTTSGAGWQDNLGAAGTGSSATGGYPNLPIVHAAWTDHRDVMPPIDGNWAHYVPPLPKGAIGSGTCEPSRAGMRNANIYTSRLTSGLFVGSPGNTKPLGFRTHPKTGAIIVDPSTGKPEHLQRGFVVFVQNSTREKKKYLMRIANQPGPGTPAVGDRASLVRVPQPPYSAKDLAQAPYTWAVTTVPPLSTVSRTVYVTSSNVKAQVRVDVAEVALEVADEVSNTTGQEPALMAGGLRMSVLLNPDPTNPSIIDPDFVSTDHPVLAEEIHDPQIFEPLVTTHSEARSSVIDIDNPPGTPDEGSTHEETPDEGSPDEGSPDEGSPDEGSPDEGSPDEGSPDEGSPDEGSPDEGSTGEANAGLENTALGDQLTQAASITDVQWKVSAKRANTTSAYKFRPTFKGGRDGKRFQLFVTKRYYVPVVNGDNCEIAVKRINQVIVNVADFQPRNPDEGSPDEGSPDEGSPDEGSPDEGSPDEGSPDEGSPDEGSPDEGSATFFLAPGETATVTLRVYDFKTTTVPDETDADFAAFAEAVTDTTAAEIQALASNTGEAAPASAAAGPDLIVYDPMPTIDVGQAAPGEDVEVRFTLQNRGTSAADTIPSGGTIKTRFYLSLDEFLTADDLALAPSTSPLPFAHETNAPIAPCTDASADACKRPIAQLLRIPRSVAPGRYFLFIVTDDDNGADDDTQEGSDSEIFEADEFNNRAAVAVTVAPFTVAFAQQPTTTTEDYTVAPPVQVVVADSRNRPVAGITVSLAIASGTGAAGAVLSGSTTQITNDGPATFDDLSIATVGNGYRLVATAVDAASAGASITPAISTAFDIVADQPPVAVADNYTVLEGSTLTIAPDAGVLANDADPAQPGTKPASRFLRALLATDPQYGDVSPTVASEFNPPIDDPDPDSLGVEGDFIYTPLRDFAGVDTFTYFASDGRTGNESPATVTISVVGVNDAPSFAKGPDQVVRNTAGTQTLVAWATDIFAGPGETQDLQFHVSVDAPALFSIQPAISADGTLTYAPAPGGDGAAIVTVTLQDNGGTANGGVDISAAQTFRIAVVPPGNARWVRPLPDVIVNEDAPDTVLDIAGYAVDPEGGTVTYAVVENHDPDLVTATIDGTILRLHYAPNGNGSTLIRIGAQGSSGEVVLDDFVVSVDMSNDAPILVRELADVTVNENADDAVVDVSDAFDDVDFNDADFGDGDQLTITISGNTNPSLVTVTPERVGLKGWQLRFHFNANESGVATITVRATDRVGAFVEDTLKVTVASTGSDPVAEDVAVTTIQDAALEGEFSASDDDGDALTFRIVDNGAKGVATVIDPFAMAATLMTGAGSELQESRECRDGWPEPQCWRQAYDTSENLAFSGSGFAAPAVARDALGNGFDELHQSRFANDGFYGNGSSWIPAAASSWIKIDLGREVWVYGLSFGRDRLNGYDDRDPGQFVIATALTDDEYANGAEGNDGAEYTTVASSAAHDFSGNLAGPETVGIAFAPVRARFVKLTVDSAEAAIDEIEVFGQLETPTANRFRYVPNPGTSGVDSFTYVANDGTSDSNVATVTVTVVPTANPPRITTPEAISAIVSEFYNQNQATQDGTPPFTWTLAGDTTLPPGLTLNASTGQISGTPTGAPGRFTYLLKVQDSLGLASSDTPQFIDVVLRDQSPGGTEDGRPHLAVGGTSSRRVAQVITAGVSAPLVAIGPGLLTCPPGTVITYEVRPLTQDGAPDESGAPLAFVTGPRGRLTLSAPVFMPAHARYAIVLTTAGDCHFPTPARSDFYPVGRALQSVDGGAWEAIPDVADLSLNGFVQPEGLHYLTRQYNGHTATALNDGRILVAGTDRTADVYDPVSGVSTRVAVDMANRRWAHTATALDDGRVLIVGGEEFEPATNTSVAIARAIAYEGNAFVDVADTIVARSQHTATKLADGRVVIIGGWTQGPGSIESVEIFNPATNAFESGGQLLSARQQHTATLLADGTILVAGGYGVSGPNAEIYNPATRTSASTSSPMTVFQAEHTATRLADGRVLLLGGNNQEAAAQIYDPATGAFGSIAAPLSLRRFQHSATLLATGDVLIAGGSHHPSFNEATSEVLWFDVASGTFRGARDMVARRADHAAVVLDSGAIAFIGGWNNGTSSGLTVERYVADTGGTTPAIRTIVLPDGRREEVYAPTAIQADGGVPPYQFAIIGTLPPGLTIEGAVISGVPTATALGTYPFVVRLTDADGDVDYQPFTIRINALEISSTPLPTAFTGTPYSTQLEAGGVAPVVWSLASGALPSGLTLDATGAISGTPTVQGFHGFSVRAQDAAGQVASRFLFIQVNSGLRISTSTVPDAIVSEWYFGQIDYSGGVGGRTYTVSSGRLPRGVILDSFGGLNGPPLETGTFTFTIQASDSSTPPQVASRQFTFTVRAIDQDIATASMRVVVGGSRQLAQIVRAGSVGFIQGIRLQAWCQAGSALEIELRGVTGNPLQPAAPRLQGAANMDMHATLPSPTGNITTVLFPDERFIPIDGSFAVVFSSAGNCEVPGTFATSSYIRGDGLAFVDGQWSTLSDADGGDLGLQTVVRPTASFAHTEWWRWTPRLAALPDGRVIILEGTLSEIYDPATRTTARGAEMAVNRNQFSATPLADGRILIAGGQAWDNATATNTIVDTAEIYDPSTGVFTLLPSRLTEPRQAHTAVLLGDGRVLITGGLGAPVEGGFFPWLDSAEIFDPATNAFTSVGTMVTSRQRHTMTRLADGRVLIVGGWGRDAGSPASAEIFDPATASFEPLAPGLNTDRSQHTATLLPDGRVLVAGGMAWSPGGTLRSTEFFDPQTQTFSYGPALAVGHNAHTATLLADGSVVIAGGASAANWEESSTLERWLPGDAAFSGAGSLGTSRIEHAAIAIGPHTVLFAGSSGATRFARHALETYDAAAFQISSSLAIPSIGIAEPYHVTLNTRGGTGPHTFRLVGGELPPGLTLDAAGTITGIPVARGTFVATVEATDATGARSYLTLRFVVRNSLRVQRPLLKRGVRGEAYTDMLQATGGAGTAASFFLEPAFGSLPLGLTLAADGTISGTPQESGSFTFVVRVEDNGVPQQVINRRIRLSVDVHDAQQLTVNPDNGGVLVGTDAGGSVAELSQSFTIARTGLLSEVRLRAFCAAGDLVIQVRGADRDVPTTEVLATQVFNGSVLRETSAAPRRFAFAEPAFLRSGEPYALVFSSTGQCRIAASPSDAAYGAGTAKFVRTDMPGTWQPHNADLYFDMVAEPVTLSAYGAANPDGRHLGDEWTHAARVNLMFNGPEGAPVPATLFVQNDNAHLHLSLVYERDEDLEDVQFRGDLNFDNDNDRNAFEDGEDALWYSFGRQTGDTRSSDAYQTINGCEPFTCWRDDESDGGARNLTARATFEDGTFTVELTHPFNTGDIFRDLATHAGKTIGMRLANEIRREGSGFDDGVYQMFPAPNQPFPITIAASSGQPIVAPHGLVSWWKGERFNELADEQALNPLAKTDSSTTATGFGIVGDAFAVRSSPTPQRVFAADHPSLSPHVGPNGAMTVEAWVKIPGYPVADPVTGLPRRAIVAKADNANRFEYALNVYGDGRVEFALFNPDGTEYGAARGGLLPLDEWHHVAGTIEKGRFVRVYLDGMLVQQDTTFAGDSADTTAPFYISGNGLGEYFESAAIDEPAIYSRALGNEEIAAIHRVGAGGKYRDAAERYALRVTSQGHGVVAAPFAISCGGDCEQLYPAGAIVTLTANTAAYGGVTFTGWGGACTGSAFSCTVTMTSDLTVYATFTTNYDPFAHSQSVAVAQDSQQAIILSGNDPEGQPLTFEITTPPAHGTLSIVSGASMTYTPDRGYAGPDSFEFIVNDGYFTSPPAHVAIVVSCTGCTFEPTGNLNVARRGAAQVLLDDGRVLVAGSDNFIRSAETYDASTGVFTPSGDLTVGRCYGCAAVKLPDGKVMLAGGWAGGPVLDSAELFDPATNTFAATGSLMTASRLGPAAVMLQTGKVLLVNGHNGFSIHRSAELYDPLTDTFVATNAPNDARLTPGVLLLDGRVLLPGGMTSSGAYLATAEIYDPATGSFVYTTGRMNTGRHGVSAVRLLDGRVLVAGGLADGNVTLDTAEIYDPATDTFASTGSMIEARSGHALMLLADGRVIAIGGAGVAGVLSSTEIYDPVSGVFVPGPSLVSPRSGASVTELPDGRMLITGGVNGGFSVAAEVLVPCATPALTPLTIDTAMPPPAVGGVAYSHALDTRGGNGRPVMWMIAEGALPPGLTLSPGGIISGTPASETNGSYTFAVRALQEQPHPQTATRTVTIDLTDPALSASGFSAAPSMATVRASHVAARLPNGRVLVAGGSDGVSVMGSAAVFNAATNEWSAAPSLSTARSAATATVLQDGRVLVAGGNDATAQTAAVEIYDPARNQWISAASMAHPRSAHTATLLSDGRVLVTGGYRPHTDPFQVYQSAAEVYDPAANTWTAVASMLTRRVYHVATLLPDGRVMVAGGANWAEYLQTAEVYDPISDAWSFAGGLRERTYGHIGVTLSDGRFVVSGGRNHFGFVLGTDIYTPSTGAWSAGPNLNGARFFGTAAGLLDDRILFTGGDDAAFVQRADSDLFDGSAWTLIGPMGGARRYHTATRLADGRVLIVGGSRNEGSLASVEIWRAP